MVQQSHSWVYIQKNCNNSKFKRLNIENVEYTYNETSFSLRREETLFYVTTWVNLDDIMLCETSVPKRQLTRDSNSSGF